MELAGGEAEVASNIRQKKKGTWYIPFAEACAVGGWSRHTQRCMWVQSCTLWPLWQLLASPPSSAPECGKNTRCDSARQTSRERGA